MPAGIMSFNSASPQCTMTPCLMQVMGSVNNDPVAQVSACVAEFGSPTTVTITLPGEVDFSTTTATVSYTDIIVTTSTTSSTHHETSTAYAEVVETVTDYSATSVATVTETVTAPTAPVQSVKKRNHKRRSCGKTSSTIESSSTHVTATSTTALYPVASNCMNLRDYSSACSCINAVSSTTTVVNSEGPTEVETITESIVVPSTSTSVVTVVVTSTTVVPATTTVTLTTTGIYETTTTVTSTATPTPSPYLVVADGPLAGTYLTTSLVYYMQHTADISRAQRFNAIPPEGGQLSLSENPILKVFVMRGTVPEGFLHMTTDENATRFDSPPVICTVDSESGLVSCTAAAMDYDTIYNCGTYFYIREANWSQAGCTPITFRLST